MFDILFEIINTFFKKVLQRDEHRKGEQFEEFVQGFLSQRSTMKFFIRLQIVLLMRNDL